MAKKVVEGTSLDDLRVREDRGFLENLCLAKMEAQKIIKDKLEDKEPVVATEALILESELTRNAIINFLTNDDLNFTISEMKASIELEELSTIAPLNAQVATSVNTNVNTALNVLSGIAVATTGGGGATVAAGSGTGKGTGVGSGKGMVTEPLQMRKDGGKHGGRMKAVGHAYVGDPDIIPGSDTTDRENDFTKVKLYYDKIPEEIL